MSAPRRAVTLAALLLSMSMAALEATVTTTAMPSIVAELGGLDLYGWATAAYLLASTVTMPVFGKLADREGRRPVLLLGLAFFVVGSTGCGAAMTAVQFIAMRSVQGVGAGAIQPVVLTVVGDLYPLEQRARVQGYFSALWGTMGVVGPLAAGLMLERLSWRWVFLINIPGGLLAAMLLVVGLREQIERSTTPLDWRGALALTVASTALLLGSDGGRAWQLAAAAVAIALFVVIERRASDPVLPMGLLTRRLVAVASAMNLLLGASMIAVVTFVPLLVQGAQGRSPTEAGAAIAPMLVGWPIAATAAGRLLRRAGFRALVLAGALATCAAAVALERAARHGAPPPLLGAIALLFGIGMGLGNTAVIISVQASVAWGERGVATAAVLFFRTIGSALGAAALGALLARRLGGGASHDAVRRLLSSARLGLDPAAAAPLTDGLQEVFGITAALGAAALLCALMFPRPAPLSPP